MREIINWPKKQYLDAATTITTAASTVTTITITTINKTTTSVASTTKADDIEKNIWGNVEGKVELNQNIPNCWYGRISNIFGAVFTTAINAAATALATNKINKKISFFKTVSKEQH